MDETKKQETKVEKKTFKKRKKRKLKKGSPRLYFHSGTQDAIVAYQNSDDIKEREDIYVKDIAPAFEKLVENLINIHKFFSLHSTFDNLKNDCVAFLFETILKFDATRGTNAFSYFNVCAKNWLIIQAKKRIQSTKRSVSMSDVMLLSGRDQKAIEESSVVESQDDIYEKKSTSDALINMLNELKYRIKTENELKCINAIITIFKNVDEIDLLNKTAILLYMRELSGLDPKKMTTTMQSIKRHYRRLKLDPKLEPLLF